MSTSLEFFAYQWSFEEITDPERTLIRIYGVDRDNKSVYVCVQDYTPTCYIELPTNITWTDSKIDTVGTKLINLNRKIHQPTSIEFVKKKKCYYSWKDVEIKDGKVEYKNKLFPFFKVSFPSNAALNTFRYKLKIPIILEGIGNVLLKIHEDNHNANIKLFANNKLPAAGWIKVTGKLIPHINRESNTSIDYEIVCQSKNIEPINDSTIPVPNVLSIDIEANSTITSAMPDSQRPDDRVFQISAVLSVGKTITKYLLTLGQVDQKLVGDDVIIRMIHSECECKCKCLKDCENECSCCNCKCKKKCVCIKEYKKEYESRLLLALVDLIHETKSKVVIGYNILGWDFKYMMERSKHLKCYSDFAKMGVLHGKQDKPVPDPSKGGNGGKFESKAFGIQELTYLDAEGVLFLDLLPIIKREYKLANYKLNTVTQHLKLESKDPLTHHDIFAAYREFTPEKLSKCGKYCVQDSYIVLLLFQKTQMWYGLCESSKTNHVPIFYLFTKGTQIQMFSQVIEYCMYNEFVIISNGYIAKEDDEYMGAYVLEPIPGKYNKILCFDFASLYPSIMRAYNIDYSTLVFEPKHYLVGVNDNKKYLDDWLKYPCYLKVLKSNFTTDGEEEVEIFNITSGTKYLNTIVARTPNELEKKITELQQESPESMIGIFEEMSEILDSHCHVFAWEDHSNCVHDLCRQKKKNGEYSTAKKKIICGQRYFRYMKQKYGGKGILPTLLENLINRRKETRVQIAKNEFQICKLLHILTYSKASKVEKYVEIKKENPDLFPDNILKVICEKEKKTIEEVENEIKIKLEKEDKIIDEIIDLELMNVVLDKRQLALKVSSNSIYGNLGLKRGMLPLYPGAMSVTYRGRCGLNFISKYIPEKYGGISVYGDTDSVMISVTSVKNNIEAVELAEKIVLDMQDFFPFPMKLEFEKIYEKYLILTKKRYMALVANKKGEIVDFSKRGVVLVRRDNCKFLREIYLKTCMKMLEDIEMKDKELIRKSNEIIPILRKKFSRNISLNITKFILSDELTCLNVVNTMLENIIFGINDLFQMKYKFRDFAITKGINRALYDQKRKLPAHVQLAERMKSRGVPIATGSRIEYVFTTISRGEKNPEQGQKIEDLDYFHKFRQYLRIDYLYYMEKQLIKPLDELLFVCLGIENFVLKQFKLRTQKYLVTTRIESFRLDTIIFEGEEILPKKKNITKKVIKKLVETKKSLPDIEIEDSDTEY